MEKLSELIPSVKIHFYLEERGRMLIVEAPDFNPDEVVNQLDICGFDCKVLL